MKHPALSGRFVEFKGSNQSLQEQPFGQRRCVVLADATLDLNTPKRPSIDGITDRRIELDFGIGFKGRCFPRVARIQGLVSLRLGLLSIKPGTD